MSINLTPTKLRVEGVLPLDHNDQAKLLAYQNHFVDTGSPEGSAFESACLQVAQDLLGGMGFSVEEIEPL